MIDQQAIAWGNESIKKKLIERGGRERERGKNLQRTCLEPQGRNQNAVKSSRT